jgi:hypothetical protein
LGYFLFNPLFPHQGIVSDFDSTYPRGMNALLNPLPGELILVVAPQAGGPIILNLIAHLACRGPLRILDGGNRFDAYRCNLAVARALDARTANLPTVLNRIQLARAFTCYQMGTLLKETLEHPIPTIVLDLLSTFYDESVPAAESQRLLETCIAHLHRLNHVAPVAVSVRPGPSSSHLKADVSRPQLLETLQASAGQVFTLDPYTPPPPPRLL